jgi:hypothetical protein
VHGAEDDPTQALTGSASGSIMKSALEFAANCPSVGKMTPTRDFSGGSVILQYTAPRKSLQDFAGPNRRAR